MFEFPSIFNKEYPPQLGQQWHQQERQGHLKMLCTV